jgi:hypothetical protein
MRVAEGFALDAAANYRSGLDPIGITYAERDVLDEGAGDLEEQKGQTESQAQQASPKGHHIPKEPPLHSSQPEAENPHQQARNNQDHHSPKATPKRGTDNPIQP